jgi:hypothetical protein
MRPRAAKMQDGEKRTSFAGGYNPWEENLLVIAKSKEVSKLTDEDYLDMLNKNNWRNPYGWVHKTLRRTCKTERYPRGRRRIFFSSANLNNPYAPAALQIRENNQLNSIRSTPEFKIDREGQSKLKHLRR